jgi:carboxyl-terminal processing protease
MPRLAPLARSLVLACCAFSGGAAVSALAHANAGESPYEWLRQLARVLVLIEDQYVEPVERGRLLEGAITGMVEKLDPHSAYLAPEDYAVFRDNTRGEFGGIGVEVEFRDDSVVVIAPIEGSPAEQAGVRSGDRIVAIDGVPVRGKPSQALVRIMRGKPGTDVVVTIRRETVPEPLQISLTRRVIQVASIAKKRLDGDIGYIRIKQFQSGTHAEFVDALAALRRDAPGRLTGMLLDLRNNPGGLVDEAVAVADEFLRHGVIYSTRRRRETVTEVRARRSGAILREPVVVLVNEYSASAAELVAGALKDHDRASIVGAPTFGKGSVQSILDLPSGAGLRLTTTRYYTPGGHAIQAQGISPDVLVKAAYARDRTFQIVKERDLADHLPAEGHAPGTELPKTSPEAAPGPDGRAPETPSSDETHLGVAKTVPSDPTGGADFALSIGYQILVGILKR